MKYFSYPRPALLWSPRMGPCMAPGCMGTVSPRVRWVF